MGSNPTAANNCSLIRVAVDTCTCMIYMYVYNVHILVLTVSTDVCVLLYMSITCVRRLIPVRKDIEVVGCKMTKHSDECGQHLQAQNMVHMAIHTCTLSSGSELT